MMTQRQAVPAAPGPLEAYALHFDDLFTRANHPVAIAELDRVGIIVDVDVGECAEHAFERSSECGPPVGRLVASGHVGDHVGVMRGVHRSDVVTVERLVALLHERQNVGDTVGGSFVGRLTPFVG